MRKNIYINSQTESELKMLQLVTQRSASALISQLIRYAHDASPEVLVSVLGHHNRTQEG